MKNSNSRKSQRSSKENRSETGNRATRASGLGSGKVRPGGQGGRRQAAGGPEHRGLDAHEDRNP